MYKQFVPLTANKSPSRNPYEIRTYMGETQKPPQTEWLANDKCTYQRNCDIPQNSTIAKVLTLQDEIRQLHKKTQDNIFLKPFNKQCKYQDQFTSCVIPRRTPEQLREHAKMCEKCLKVQHEMKERVHDVGCLYTKHQSLIELKDPFEDFEEEDGEMNECESEEGIKPELASPDCSKELIYVPTRNIVSRNLNSFFNLYLKE